jgi:hypothetical protein
VSAAGAVATGFGGMLTPGDGGCRAFRIRIPGIASRPVRIQEVKEARTAV